MSYKYLKKIANYNLTSFLLIIMFMLSAFAFSNNEVIKDGNDNNISIKNNTIVLADLSIEQKIKQMMFVSHIDSLKDYYKNNNYGGIFIAGKKNKSKFIEIGNFYECDNNCIKPFLSVDLEGKYSNPFSNFEDFNCFSDIKSKDEAYNLGQKQSKLLKELNIDMIFSPVLDLKDNIWNCRSFTHFNNDSNELTNIARSYIQGLKLNNIITISKHYPGKTLINLDPHKTEIKVNITKEDLIPFEKLYNDVDGIMVTHSIANGYLNSFNKPSSVSKSVISQIKKNFDGLIIADDVVQMNAINDYYKINNISSDQMYIDLINAGNDLIIFFDLNEDNMKHFVNTVTNAINNNKIDEKTIDSSVTKILKEKGYKVIN